MGIGGMVITDDEVHAQISGIADLLMCLDTSIYRYDQSSSDAVGIVYPLPRDTIALLISVWDIVGEMIL